jgi:hypothetical protein
MAILANGLINLKKDILKFWEKNMLKTWSIIVFLEHGQQSLCPPSKKIM